MFGITLQRPNCVPAWAEPLSPHLASLSIEMDRWTDWAGAEIGQPDEYVNQLLRSLGERTGSMPLLRVGGELPVLSTVFPGNHRRADAQHTQHTYSHRPSLSALRTVSLLEPLAIAKALTRVLDMVSSKLSGQGRLGSFSASYERDVS